MNNIKPRFGLNLVRRRFNKTKEWESLYETNFVINTKLLQNYAALLAVIKAKASVNTFFQTSNFYLFLFRLHAIKI